MLLSTLTAALLSATVTNTELVHDLATYNGHVVACTEGGLELFTRSGRAVRTLTVDDGLPSHFCRALEVAGDELFAATDEGVVAVDKGWRVQPVVGAKWHALPAEGGMNAELYRAALGWLSERLPAGPTYTAFTESYLGTADGRVMAPGSERMWTVPGPVRMLEEKDGVLRVGTTEGAFTLGAEGLVSLPVPAGPLAYAKDAKGGTRVLGAEGEARHWGERSGEARALPPGTTSTVELNGVAWAGTRGQGVFRRQGAEWKRVTPTGQLCGNHITALTRHQGLRVVGTFDKGVCWEQPDGKWRTFRAPHLPSNHVLGLASDGRNLYVATMSGLGLYDGKTWTPMAYGGRNPVALGKLSVLAAVPDTEEGVALVDGRGTSFVKRASQPLELAKRLPLPEGWSTHVSGAHGAGRYLWVASEDRGLLRWDGMQWTRFHDGKHLTDNWVTALSADAEGRAVVGTCQDGFSYFDGERWTRVRDAEGLPSRYVVSTALVPGGALLGTLLGAAHYDARSGTVRPLPRLADPRVYALWVEEGTVLFGTEGGLSQLDWSAPAALTRR